MSAVAGLTSQQVTEKLRGPEGTNVRLKILRKDSDPIRTVDDARDHQAEVRGRHAKMNSNATLTVGLGRDTLLLSFLLFCSSASAQEALRSHLEPLRPLKALVPIWQNNPLADSKPSNFRKKTCLELPISLIQKLSGERSVEIVGSNRSARDAQLYRQIAPSVVRILTNSGRGSGSLIGSSGEILTNLHVVEGQSQVAVVFKPAVEGSIPTRDDIKLGQVIKYDEVTDLALVRATDVPKGRVPIRTRRFERNGNRRRRKCDWPPR